MKHRERFHDQMGAIGYLLLWLLGIPIPILILIFVIRGCTQDTVEGHNVLEVREHPLIKRKFDLFLRQNFCRWINGLPLYIPAKRERFDIHILHLW